MSDINPVSNPPAASQARLTWFLDFDGTLTKQAGNETFDDISKSKIGHTNMENPAKMANLQPEMKEFAQLQSADENKKIDTDTYNFLKERLKAGDEVVIISKNYNEYIKAMLSVPEEADTSTDKTSFEDYMNSGSFFIYDRNAILNEKKMDKGYAVTEHANKRWQDGKDHLAMVIDDDKKDFVKMTEAAKVATKNENRVGGTNKETTKSFKGDKFKRQALNLAVQNKYDDVANNLLASSNSKEIAKTLKKAVDTNIDTAIYLTKLAIDSGCFYSAMKNAIHNNDYNSFEFLYNMKTDFGKRPFQECFHYIDPKLSDGKEWFKALSDDAKGKDIRFTELLMSKAHYMHHSTK